MSKRDKIRAAIDKKHGTQLGELIEKLHRQFPQLRLPISNSVDSILRVADGNADVESVLCGLLGISRPQDDAAENAQKALKRSCEANIVALGALILAAMALYFSLRQ